VKIKIYIAFISTLILTIFFYAYIKKSQNEVIQNVANKNLAAMDIANKSILNTYMLVAEKNFLDIMKNKKALKILKEFKYADDDNKALLRGELFRLLYKDYEILSKYNVRQFHIHTHDAKSLLRFHHPYKNGDSLDIARTSIRVANSEFKTMVGFEGGKIFPAYRYVFPMIYENEHLGSIEFSISFEGIEKRLKSILPFYAHKIILKKEISYDKVFKDYRDYFVESSYGKDYYLENHEISKVTKKIKDDIFIKELTLLAKRSENFRENLKHENSFAIPIVKNNNGFVVTFLAITDIDNKIAGYIVSYAKLQEIIQIQSRYKNFIFIILFAALLLFILTTAIILQVQKVKEQTLKLQKFIDIQNSIVILTDGKKFKFANKKFFDFFQYADIEDFLQKHSCICDLFVYNKNFFSLDDVKEGEANWVESLLNLSGRNRIVSMLDKTSTPHAFTVSINRYDKDNYVINFTDVSDAMTEKLQLQQQVVRDQLTKSYNRVYFEKNIDSIIANNISENKNTGIIFFDIDHFKKINDTFGHRVGDDILKGLVELVKQNIRSNEKLIRWGGEEFLIIIPANTIDEIYKEAEKLRKLIEMNDFAVVKHLTCSFGLALNDENTTIEETILKADDKLYEAKTNGRNRVAFSFT